MRAQPTAGNVVLILAFHAESPLMLVERAMPTTTKSRRRLSWLENEAGRVVSDVVCLLRVMMDVATWSVSVGCHFVLHAVYHWMGVIASFSSHLCWMLMIVD